MPRPWSYTQPQSYRQSQPANPNPIAKPNLTPGESCRGFDSDGIDRGVSIALAENLDYGVLLLTLTLTLTQAYQWRSPRTSTTAWSL